MGDGRDAKVSFGAALLRSVFLAHRLRKIWEGQKMVGILLPPSVPGTLVNHAAMLLGKVPVNLNYTVSEEILASCIRQCDIKTVVTSRMVLEKLKLKLSCEVVLLEDVAASPSAGEKLAAAFFAFLAPDLIKAAFDGTLPDGCGVVTMTELSMRWETQLKQFI